jgi:hypothetical protein
MVKECRRGPEAPSLVMMRSTGIECLYQVPKPSRMVAVGAPRGFRQDRPGRTLRLQLKVGDYRDACLHLPGRTIF